MQVTASKLRQDIYRYLDQVIETGVPLDIRRKGKRLKIVSQEPVDIFAKLVRRNCTTCKPEDLIHNDWYGEWKP